MTERGMIAALFVQKDGAYYGMEDIDPWDEERDARKYAGPHPVVAHPPCARFGRMAKQIEWRGQGKVGDDGGCFASALASVRAWGGVLEHPAYSLAWEIYGLTKPNGRGWIRCFDGSWVCEVAQAAYGHRARKWTWLFYIGRTAPQTLDWGNGKPTVTISSYSRKRDRRDFSPRMHSQHERLATPTLFRDALIGIAKGVSDGS